MMIKKQPNGLWSVVDGDQVVVINLTNAQAWRKLEQIKGEASSPSQHRQEWAFNKGANGE